MIKAKKMITLTFPDGNKKDYNKGVTGIQVAENIAKSLAKEAIAMSLDGNQKDINDNITSDSKISIITTKSEEGLEIMRHTLAATSNPCDNSTMEELVEPAIDEALVVGATNAPGSA